MEHIISEKMYLQTGGEVVAGVLFFALIIVVMVLIF